MSALQVAPDYAAEEGFRITRDAEGQWIEIHHPQGGARVQKDGSILCETNPMLNQVLEKKLAQARDKEAQLVKDPEGRITIKFSAEYEKMPADISHTTLLAVLKVKRSHLLPQFLEWIPNSAARKAAFCSPPPRSTSSFCFYPPLSLPFPKLQALSSPSSGQLSVQPEKEGLYRSHVGELVNIEIKGET